MYYIGIDPGLKGGIAIIDDDQNIVKVISMPVLKSRKGRTQYDIHLIYHWFKRYQSTSIATIEKIQAMRLNGVIANKMSGYCEGIFDMLFLAQQIPYQVIPAKMWQKTILKGINLKDTKLASISFVKRKYPLQSLRETERCRKDHDGMADAINIALYGWWLNNKG